MAGRGTRLRPHTLTVPKPLLPVAGKPIVQRIVEDLIAGFEGKVEEIAFIVGDFGAETEQALLDVAAKLGTKGAIYRQDKPLGTAHAIYCAEPSLTGPVLVAFADTLFNSNFHFDNECDGVIWVSRVEDPRAFGVVKVNAEGHITDFVEKPETFVSDQAIVGIYYFKDGDNLREEIKYLLDNDIRDKGEYQLTNALENMKAKGRKFKPGIIEEWLDCGNKDNVVYTNQRMLSLKYGKEPLVSPQARLINSVIIPPCYIGEGAELRNSVVGPFVSIGEHTQVDHAVVSNSIIGQNARIANGRIADSMLGSHVQYTGQVQDVSLGDYTVYSA